MESNTGTIDCSDPALFAYRIETMHIHDENAARTVPTSSDTRTLETAIPYVSWYFVAKPSDGGYSSNMVKPT
jgi:hypothetical protein